MARPRRSEQFLGMSLTDSFEENWGSRGVRFTASFLDTKGNIMGKKHRIIKATSPGDWIFSQFPTHPTARQLQHWKNIFWRVALMWIPPRDERFEFINEMGRAHLDAVLNNQLLKISKTNNGGQRIFFVFPERYLTTQEEHVFCDCLARHDQILAAKLTIIDLVTKSPLIIGNFLSDDVRVIKDTTNYDRGLSKEHHTAKFQTTDAMYRGGEVPSIFSMEFDNTLR